MAKDDGVEVRILKCTAHNFGSYDEISFNFNDLGLTLVQGPTGAGKSTLFDIPCWTLYGVTSKNGTVDEVRAWGSSDTTSCSVEVTTKTGAQITVHRIRGTARDNDLHWCENGEVKRGKDLKDTQRLLDDLLGVNVSLYLYAAYLSEFSPSTMFFVAGPKSRKMLLQSLTDLSFSSRLEETVKANAKDLKGRLEAQNKVVDYLTISLQNAHNNLVQNNKDLDAWYRTRDFEVTKLRNKAKYFEEEKQANIAEHAKAADQWAKNKAIVLDDRIKELDKLKEELASLCTEPCKECGRTTPESDRANRTSYRIQSLEKEHTKAESTVNPYLIRLEKAKEARNTYKEEAQKESKRVNPFLENCTKLQETERLLSAQLDTEKLTMSSIESMQSDMKTLLEVSDNMRNYLLQKSVSDLKDLTNHYLGTHFSGEFSVDLQLQGSDDLDAVIAKNGNPCSYTQLSKGQRGLLKLCFSASVMKISANNVGITFDNVFLDEALDGFDTDLKVKAISMLQELSEEHKSVMIIDHSMELKAAIDSRVTVKLVGDRSELEF